MYELDTLIVFGAWNVGAGPWNRSLSRPKRSPPDLGPSTGSAADPMIRGGSYGFRCRWVEERRRRDWAAAKGLSSEAIGRRRRV